MDAEIALWEFLRPPAPVRELRREEEVLQVAEMSRLTLVPGTENDEEEIAIYQWGQESRRVLLVHGWGGKAVQFFALIEALRQRGFSVVAFDAPAHGRSTGTLSSGPAFARTARKVAELKGPFFGLVAHSLGAAGSAIALSQGLQVGRVALLAPVAFIEPLLELFIRIRQITGPVATELRQRFAARYEAQIISVPMLAKNVTVPVLIQHDPDDASLPFWHSESIAASWPGAQLVPVPGTGHWRILRDRAVTERTVGFLER
jgi:pimeloyl-ACP methyl ester carboxylesterase